MSSGKAREQEAGSCTTVVAAFGALAFLAGRHSRSGKPVTPEIPATSPPAKRTKTERFFHWFRWPVRKKDQLRKARGEIPAKAPASAKGKAEEPPGKPEKSAAESSGLTGMVLKVLGAVAAGVGVVGAVTVVGGAIFWARFDAIELPATQAVSVMPKEELLVQGTQEVVLFLLVGLGAALLIAFADPKGIVTRGTLIVLGGLIGGALIYAITTSLAWYWVAGLTLLTLVLALACVAMAFTTGQRLLPLLISVFLASLVFSSSCALLIVQTQKYAQAIAIRFGVDEETQEGKGLTGIYVTATEETIYFARSGRDPEIEAVDTTGLYEVPRADTTTFVVGPLVPTDDSGDVDRVEASAKRMLRRLNLDGESFDTPPKEPEATTDSG